MGSRCDPRPTCEELSEVPPASFLKRYKQAYEKLPKCFVYRDFPWKCCSRRVWSCNSNIEGCEAACHPVECPPCEVLSAPNCGPTQDLIQEIIQNPASDNEE